MQAEIVFFKFTHLPSSQQNTVVLYSSFTVCTFKGISMAKKDKKWSCTETLCQMTEQSAWKELEWQPLFYLMRGCSCQVNLYTALWQLPAYWHVAVSSTTCSCQLPEMQVFDSVTDMKLSAHWHAAVRSLTCSCAAHDMQLSPWTLFSCEHRHYLADNASPMQLITSTTQQLTMRW